ncbi:hypothetical protein CNR22_12615 [Sphingobacteriaceae bacterium]|nr:hypothetical protein CNR22_12615 [Sphingobacteriaceae bacterium]
MKTKLFFLVILSAFLTTITKAQMINNGTFFWGTLYWNCSAETGTEVFYGGSNLFNTVSEVDASAGLCQSMSSLTIGDAYYVTFDASRRTTAVAGSPSVTNVDVVVSGGTFSSTVTRTNTSFGWVSSGFVFVATSTLHTISFSPGSGLTINSGMIIDNISITASPLSIKLLTFEGQLQDNQVVFNWATASEKNNSFFEIERSTDGSLFTSLGKIDSKAIGGNSSTKLTYQTDDLFPQEGDNYYRLKQVDYDNTVSYSKVIVVSMNKKQEDVSKLFPNPNNGEFTIDLGSPRRVDISIIDRFGKVVHSEQQNSDKESSLVKINTNRLLTTGLYQCVVTSENYTKNFHLRIE